MTATTGVAFSEASDGDLRGDRVARSAFAARLGAPDRWAVVRQVHGSRVVQADTDGDRGEADAVFTTVPGLAVAVFTADCAGVVLVADGAVGVAHAGWRGAADGVVPALVEAMTTAGVPPAAAHLGPLIGPCCFEVGPEVAARFPEAGATTDWGTTSVDLGSVIEHQLGPIPLERHGGCTRHDARWFSHRRDATPRRLAAIGWLR